MADIHRHDRTSHPPLPALVADVDAGDKGRDIFSIRDLTKEFHVTARTLRFYEEKGLIAPRRSGQERLYGRRDRARLKLALMGKTVGFSLDEIREMLDLYDVGDGQVTQLKVALGRFQDRIKQLQRQRSDIDKAISELSRASKAVEAMLGARSKR